MDSFKPLKINGKTSVCLAIFVFVIMVNKSLSQIIDPTYLSFGSEDVGFKSTWETDYSQAYIYDGVYINRPILINLWYPAIYNENIKMSYGDYFDFDVKSVTLNHLSRDYVKYNLATLSFQIFGKEPEELSEIENEVLQKFLKRKIDVKKNAVEKDGKFPLIIYHQGFGASFEDNALLCQFLASNGYVVIGSSFFHNSDEDFGVMGGEQSVKDIYYLINYASALDNVDISNVALIGHSGGAQASILAKSTKNNLIKAVVSLETTQETFGLADTRWNGYTKPVLEKLTNMNGSLLAFAEHKAVFQLFDLMTAADRYYVTFPETLNHNEYISQGIFANHLNFEVQKKEGNGPSNQVDNLKQDLINYCKVNNYILDFLQWKLKHIEPNPEIFKKDEYLKSTNFKYPMVQTVPAGEESPLTYDLESSIMPSPRQVWSMARSIPMDALIHILGHFKESDSKSPIYNDIFAFALIAQLIEEGRISDAKKLFDFYEVQGIPVRERFISLGKFSILMQRKVYAKKCFINLLKVDPNNPDAKNELKRMSSTNN